MTTVDPRPISVAAPGPERPGPARRSPVVLAGAALLCGLGVAASGITLVRAADETGILDIFRSDHLTRAARAVRLKERPVRAPAAGSAQATHAPPTLPASGAAYASDPSPVRKPVARKARVAMATIGDALASRRTMCVRVCDGYTFPLGTLAGSRDLSSHQAGCASACPGAETALYTLAPGQKTEPAFARSLVDGSPYGRLSTAFRFQRERVPACSCQGADNVARRLPILLDPTLRSGDVVVDREGAAKVYAGRGQVPHSPRAFADFRQSPALTRQTQAQVDRVMGVSQREARARAFARQNAIREAALPSGRGFEPVGRVREANLREVAAPAGSGANVRVYSATMAGAQIHGSGARIIEVR